MSTPTAHAQRARLLGQDGFTLWLTGLSGAGKTTIGTHLERRDLIRPAFPVDAFRLRDTTYSYSN